MYICLVNDSLAFQDEQLISRVSVNGPGQKENTFFVSPIVRSIFPSEFPWVDKSFIWKLHFLVQVVTVIKKYYVIFIIVWNARKEKNNVCVLDSVSVFNTIFYVLIFGSKCLMSLLIWRHLSYGFPYLLSSLKYDNINHSKITFILLRYRSVSFRIDSQYINNC